MRSFLFILFLLLFTTKAFAVGTVFTKPAGSTTKAETSVIEAPNQQITKTADKQYRIETGNKNLLINPSFETPGAGVLQPGWDSINCTPSTSVVRDGKQSCGYTVSTFVDTGISVYQVVNPTTDRTGAWELSMWIRTSSTNISVCAIDASLTELSCQAVTNDGTWRLITININPPSSGGFGIGVKVPSFPKSFSVDDAYVGPARNMGQGVPPNTFSAKVSAAGVVSDENQDFINGNCSIASTSNYTCTFNSNFFTQTPSCTATPFAGSGAISVLINAQSSSAVTAVTFTTNTTTNTAAAFNLVCTKAGSDFMQSTITPSNWNYSQKNWASTLSLQGFGTPTANGCDYSRIGSKLFGSCLVTAGTTTAVEARINLPESLKVSSKYTSRRIVGEAWRANGAATTRKKFPISAVGGNTYLNFGNDDYTVAVSPFTAQNGSDLLSTGETMSFQFWVDAADASGDWTETYAAPQLLGSVTSNSNSAQRDEWVNLNLSGASTVSVINASSSWYTSFSASSSVITATWPAGTWSALPSCQVTCLASVSNVFGEMGATMTTTGVNFACVNTSNSPALSSFISVRCVGPR